MRHHGGFWEASGAAGHSIHRNAFLVEFAIFGWDRPIRSALKQQRAPARVTTDMRDIMSINTVDVGGVNLGLGGRRCLVDWADAVHLSKNKLGLREIQQMNQFEFGVSWIGTNNTTAGSDDCQPDQGIPDLLQRGSTPWSVKSHSVKMKQCKTAIAGF